MINFSRIEENLFVGSAPHGEIDAKRLSQMKITAVISLQSDDDLKMHRIDWTSLQSAYEAYDIFAQRFAIVDFSESDLGDKLPKPVQSLNHLLAIGHRVYVHCNAGICRAPATVLTYLCHFRGMEPQTALDYLRQQRPQVHPYMTSVDIALRALKQTPAEQSD